MCAWVRVLCVEWRLLKKKGAPFPANRYRRSPIAVVVPVPIEVRQICYPLSKVQITGNLSFAALVRDIQASREAGQPDPLVCKVLKLHPFPPRRSHSVR